jgi:hypothetical protein
LQIGLIIFLITLVMGICAYVRGITHLWIILEHRICGYLDVSRYVKMVQITHCCKLPLGILYNALKQASVISLTQFARFQLNELVPESLFSSPGTVGGGRSVLGVPFGRPPPRVDRLDILAVLTVGVA